MELKHWRFEDSESDSTEQRASKRPRMNVHDNEEGQGSDKYQSKGG